MALLGAYGSQLSYLEYPIASHTLHMYLTYSQAMMFQTLLLTGSEEGDYRVPSKPGMGESDTCKVCLCYACASQRQ